MKWGFLLLFFYFKLLKMNDAIENANKPQFSSVESMDVFALIDHLILKHIDPGFDPENPNILKEYIENPNYKQLNEMATKLLFSSSKEILEDHPRQRTASAWKSDIVNCIDLRLSGRDITPLVSSIETIMNLHAKKLISNEVFMQ